MPSLLEYMRANRLSLRDFGELLGLHRTYVQRLVTGQRAPSVKVLRQIHERTAIPLKKLVYECT